MLIELSCIYLGSAHRIWPSCNKEALACNHLRISCVFGMLQLGQAVAVTGATYAEYTVAKEARCFPTRESSAESVALCLSGTTAAGALLVSACNLFRVSALVEWSDIASLVFLKVL